MKILKTLLVLFLALGANAMGAPQFFPLDNGVGRGKWTPEKQASVLKELGYDGISYNYTNNEDLAERIKAFDAHRLKIFALYVHVDVDSTPHYDPGLKDALALLEGRGTVIWATVRSPKGATGFDTQAAAVIGELADLAARRGLRIVIYPHFGFYIPSAVDALRLARVVNRPNVSPGLNLCHEFLSGNGDRLDETIKAVAPHCGLLSVNGVDVVNGTNGFVLRLDQGDFDVLAFVRKVMAAGYRGPIGLQCYAVPGDNYENLKASMAAWRQMASRLEGPELGVTLALPDLPVHSVRILHEFAATPRDGILKSYRIQMPPYDSVCYFAADESGVRGWPKLPGNANRILPWIIRQKAAGLFRPDYVQNPAVRRPTRQGVFALFQLESGEFLALLPLAGAETMSWLEWDEDGNLLVRLGTFGTAPVQTDAPLLAWARSADPYAASREVWAEALACPQIEGRTAWRREKYYHQPFRYLGWCTYEQFRLERRELSAALLTDTLTALENSDVPIRWVLVDAGHDSLRNSRLTSFAPDAVRFPQGWTPVMAKRRPDKIRWLGLWHCFEGQLKNLDPENDFGVLLSSHLMCMGDGSLLPKDDPESAAAFYDAFIGSVQRYGFDFAKVDFQTSNLAAYVGQANAVRASAHNSQALERAADRDLNGLINCMAHNPVCFFNTRSSAVTRSSIDYHMGNASEAKSHLLQSYANTLWMGQTVWPDHDMFHSSDPYCGRMMAVSKALSGGPVYLSDAPNALVAEYIRPLCYSDGELLRPLAPAVPLPDSVFTDVLNEPQAYRVIAPLANGAAAIALYNLNARDEETTLRAAVRAEDYRHAGGMMQPYPGVFDLPPEGLVAYDWYAGRGARLEDDWSVTLKGFSDALVLLTPIRHGWSVIGRADKYLAPAAVTSIQAKANKLTVTLEQSGPLLVYSVAPPSSDRGTVTAQGGNIWRIDLPVGRSEYRVVLTRAGGN
jgi:sugar phosphate isomerase/epimerase